MAKPKAVMREESRASPLSVPGCLRLTPNIPIKTEIWLVVQLHEVRQFARNSMVTHRWDSEGEVNRNHLLCWEVTSGSVARLAGRGPLLSVALLDLFCRESTVLNTVCLAPFTSTTLTRVHLKFIISKETQDTGGFVSRILNVSHPKCAVETQHLEGDVFWNLSTNRSSSPKLGFFRKKKKKKERKEK